MGRLPEQFSRRQIAAVHVWPSCLTVNNKHLMKLQIQLRDGTRSIRLLTGRRRDELELLADKLQRAIQTGGIIPPRPAAPEQ